MRNPAAARSPTAAVARWWPGVYKILIFCPAMSALLLRRAFLYLGVISARDRATAPVHCSVSVSKLVKSLESVVIQGRWS